MSTGDSRDNSKQLWPCGGLQVIKDPDPYQTCVSHRNDQEIPGGGESINQLYQRSTCSLKRIGNKHRRIGKLVVKLIVMHTIYDHVPIAGERVVVVTHGSVIRALHRRASPYNPPVGKVLNTSVNVFHLSDGDEWTMKAWSDVSHLNQTGFLESGFGGDRTSG